MPACTLPTALHAGQGLAPARGRALEYSRPAFWHTSQALLQPPALTQLQVSTPHSLPTPAPSRQRRSRSRLQVVPPVMPVLDDKDERSVAVVVVDHGSKRQESNDMLTEFVALFKEVTGRHIVEGAHMELAPPTIADAVRRCREQGARKVVVAPYFLSRGRHIQDDIPQLVKEAQAQNPDVDIVLADPLGIDPLLAQLVDKRVQAALHAHAHH